MKINGGLDPKGSYPGILGATVKYEFDQSSYNVTFPLGYVSPGGGIETDDTPAGMTDADGTSAGGFTGMDGHQDNRADAVGTVQSMGGQRDALPIIKGLKTGQGLNGRSKVMVEVENGGLMRYQWQYRVEKGQDVWEDIFGATASQYILSGKFAAGESYDLRCKIISPTGRVTMTEVITVTAAAAKTGGKLQSK